MKQNGYQIIDEMYGRSHVETVDEDSVEEDSVEEDYSEKEKGTLKKAFGKAKGKSQAQRKKIIRKAFGKVSG